MSDAGLGNKTVLPLGAAFSCGSNSEVLSRKSRSCKLNVRAKCELSVLLSTTNAEREYVEISFRTVANTVCSSWPTAQLLEAATSDCEKAAFAVSIDLAPKLDPSNTPSFTAKQGQYLTFIWNYTKIHGQAP